jgi:hypothetical protein
LDIKDCYRSIKISFPKLSKHLPDTIVCKKLTILLEIIHKQYEFINSNEVQGRVSVPIGLVSSGVLANWYLSDLDEMIKKKLGPVYYGRYVDDILIVMPASKKQKNINANQIIDKYLVRNKIISRDSHKKSTFRVMPYRYSDPLLIQLDKVTLFYFDSKQPTSVLDKFQSVIRKSSSEFNFLPEDDGMIEEFNEASCSIAYSGTINKIRNIKAFHEDKFGISKFLAKKIFYSLQSTPRVDNVATDQILSFFSGKRALEHHHQWEKVFTFFVIHNQQEEFFKFYKTVLDAIDELSSIKELNSKIIKRNLKEYLRGASCLALALEPKFISGLGNNKSIVLKICNGLCEEV